MITDDVMPFKLKKHSGLFTNPNQPYRGELRDLVLKRDLKGMMAIYRRYPQAIHQVFPFMRTALHEAGRLGDRAIVEYLLIKDCSKVNARDQWGRTPLWLACWWCLPQIVKLLLDAGGDWTIADEAKGRRPAEVVGLARHSDPISRRIILAMIEAKAIEVGDVEDDEGEEASG